MLTNQQNILKKTKFYSNKLGWRKVEDISCNMFWLARNIFSF